MTTLRKQTAIGLFVLGGLILTVTALTILGSGRLFSDSTRFVLFFQDSISGLNVGAPVLFRGVKVGQVTDIRLSAGTTDMEIHIPVIVEIKPFLLSEDSESQNLEQTMEGLIDRGLRGQLALQSLVTGQYQVSLDFFSSTKPTYISHSTNYPEIPTIPSSLQELTSSMSELPLQDMAHQLTQVITRMNQLLVHKDLEQGLGHLRRTLHNTEQLSERLNTDLPRTLSSFRSTSNATKELIVQAESDLHRLSTSLTKVADGAEKLVTTADRHIGPLLYGLEQTFTTAGDTLEQTRNSLSELSSLISQDSDLHQELIRTLREFHNAARAVQNLSDYLERHPEALLRGKRGY
jgi:paraquat-inducible protein B